MVADSNVWTVWQILHALGCDLRIEEPYTETRESEYSILNFLFHIFPNTQQLFFTESLHI